MNVLGFGGKRAVNQEGWLGGLESMKKGILAVTMALAGCMAGTGMAAKVLSKKVMQKEDILKKMIEFYHIFNYWLTLKQEGVFLADYFRKNGYQTVAIYGMKELGERLYEELAGSGIEVKYIIDKNVDGIYSEVDVVTPDEELEEVDVIVVTAPHYFDEIEEMLSQKVDYPVISIEDVVYQAG